MNYDEREGRAGQTRGSARRDAGRQLREHHCWQLAAGCCCVGRLDKTFIFLPAPYLIYRPTYLPYTPIHLPTGVTTQRDSWASTRSDQIPPPSD